jgi:paraquat-inducible protein B
MRAATLRSNFEAMMISVIKEVIEFLKLSKKIWMLPFIALLVLIGTILFFAQGSVFAPFIYTLF